MDDLPVIERDKIESFIRHPAWELLEGWINAQGSAERLVGLGDWEVYRRTLVEVEFARAFRGRIDEYLENSITN